MLAYGAKLYIRKRQRGKINQVEKSKEQRRKVCLNYVYMRIAVDQILLQ